jgi:transglutaminase-like putative cysteine protease
MERWDIRLTGGHKEVDFVDHHGNIVDLITVEPGVTEMSVTCEGVVVTEDNGGVATSIPGTAPLWLYKRSTELTEAGPGVAALVREVSGVGSLDRVATMHLLCAAVSSQVSYEPGWTDSATAAEDAIAAGRGVCQDHAHVFVSAARSMGVPARYISGYLVTDPNAVVDQASHAWAEVWIDALGWVGFDVSNGVCPDDRYIRVAAGLDYSEASPVTGIRFGVANEAMHVNLQVQQ